MNSNIYKSNFFKIALIGLLFLPALVAKAAGPEPADSLICYKTLPSCAPNREFEKNIQREFYTSANGTTVLYNRYGQIRAYTWNEKKVKINIQIFVNASDQRNADKLLEKINVNFVNTNGYIKAETVIQQSNTSIWDQFNSQPQYSDFRVNYEVWLPADNQLDIANRYGDTYISALNGRLLADIKHGDIQVEAVRNDINLKMEHGHAILKGAQNIYGQVISGSIVADQANQVQMETRNAKCTFRRANDVTLTSKYDEINIGVIQSLRLQALFTNLTALETQSAWITTQYGDLHFNHITKILDANCQYGDLEISKINAGFQNIQINTQHTDVHISTGGAPYRFSIKNDHATVVYPKGAVYNQSVAAAYNGNRTMVKEAYPVLKEGYVGSPNSKSQFKANLTYGRLTFK